MNGIAAHKAVYVGVGLALVWILVGFLLFRDDIDAYVMNVWTEAAGIVVTFLVLDIYIRNRDAKQAENSEKARLLSELGSSAEHVAVRAAEVLRQRRWLSDGTLDSARVVGADWRKINLQGARMRNADGVGVNADGAVLAGADLMGAQFVYSTMTQAILQSVNLCKANISCVDATDCDFTRSCFRDAQLISATLKNARLEACSLVRADLQSANLRGAILLKADLRGAELSLVEMDGKTVLPDGSSYREEVGLDRFTNPDNPNFWSPPDLEWVCSRSDNP